MRELVSETVFEFLKNRERIQDIMQALQLILITLKIMGYIKGGWMLVLLPTWISLFCMTIVNFIKIRKGRRTMTIKEGT